MDEVENEDHNSPLADEEERTENNYVQSSSDEEKPHEYSGPVPSAPEDPSIPHSSISYPKASDSSSSSDNEENFEPVYKRSQTIEQKISSLNEYGIEIQVNNPQIKSTTFRKHVLYTVAGNDSIGGFQVQRRYKEFLALRKILVVEWPGCCIIQLPPKQAMVNVI